VATVVTDVAGIDKAFDYLVPAGSAVGVGTIVRVDLHGRRVGGWVVAARQGGAGGRELRPLAKVRGVGPEPAIVELAAWAAWRWAAKRATFLAAASPAGAVTRLPAPSLQPPAPPEQAAGWMKESGVHVLRLPPAADATAVVAGAAQLGPTLVVVPSVARAGVLAARLRRAGGDVALLPGDWAKARAGASVVVGARAGAWGPCPGIAVVVVLDAHDELLAQEGAPTWGAVAVVIERARRAGVPAVLATPCPTPELLAEGRLHLVERGEELAGWAIVEVVDRRGDDPRLGLYSSRLVELVRAGGPVACVLNRKGRLRLLACTACSELVRCARCSGAMSETARGRLDCGRCGESRPTVCSNCGSMRLKALRIGTARAREELETLAGRPVGEVTASTGDLPDADVLVGTEALLRRLTPARRLGAIAFVDFDQELLAPRVRAGDEALALLALASRLVRGRRGRVLLQTRMPDHPVVRAAAAADPAIAVDAESGLRESLRFPPFAAVAIVRGESARGYVDGLRALPGIEVLGPNEDRWMVKAPDLPALSDALAAVPRPSGTLRVAVDPARL
jgi:primosomal protein N' (replication factor Y)